MLLVRQNPIVRLRPMPRRDASRPRTGFWRSAGLVVSALLGLSAICFVVFSTSAKQSQIGVLLGAWAAFIAAPTIFSARRSSQLSEVVRRAQHDSDALDDARLKISQLQDAQLDAARQATREAQKSQEVELRRFGEVQLARETAARREADLRLEIALRGEIERVLNEQLGSLRAEVAKLRAEVVDKLGGELRLERIETTRVIASDIEALQSEIRRLGFHRERLAAPEPAVERDIVDAEIVHPEPPEQREPSPRQQPPQPQPAQPQQAQPQPAQPQSGQPQQAQPQPQPAQPETTVRPAETPQPNPADIFAGLPRLTPLPREFADLIDPIQERAAAAEPQSASENVADGQNGAARRYVGRRRAAGEEEPEQPPAGGRRRAPDDAPDDLLARLRRT